MEKLATLLWILFALGAFVFRLIKKAQETTAREKQERPRRPQNDAPALPTATFQEMLRQMQARNAAEPDSPRPVAVPPVPQPAAPRTLAGRPMPQEVARPARSQERTTVPQRSLEAPATARPHNAPAPSPQRSTGLSKADRQRPQQFKSEPAAGSTTDTVREMLRRTEGVRAAFVLSEIFARKYE
ncbi:hypothetical protein MUN81_10585 [Hymenobacter sp. 5317J-9]|uniref:hypothetical protein n=1 Tax=Hymenobacter sp. 5317J-9 TaxID=2932250 RepID=UPI001FD68F09|nr:hypothetical protein [Hymenobacter sp. 5317J-9]UOQ99925.1 hypothetical protein MUN81_10585 [Hymenobacter sp. 5317J-9]